jgi:hypothetical protein
LREKYPTTFRLQFSFVSKSLKTDGVGGKSIEVHDPSEANIFGQQEPVESPPIDGNQVMSKPANRYKSTKTKQNQSSKNVAKDCPHGKDPFSDVHIDLFQPPENAPDDAKSKWSSAVLMMRSSISR